MKVEIISYDDLADEEKRHQPNNGSGKEYASYLKVSHNGEVVALESDAMEPEDCTFGRDLAWVGELVSKCYKLGKGADSHTNSTERGEG